MRYGVYRLSPYPWERQFAGIAPRELIGLVYSADDLNACIFAATLWANWLNEVAWIWDSQASKWLRSAAPGAHLQNSTILTPAISPTGGP